MTRGPSSSRSWTRRRRRRHRQAAMETPPGALRGTRRQRPRALIRIGKLAKDRTLSPTRPQGVQTRDSRHAPVRRRRRGPVFLRRWGRAFASINRPTHLPTWCAGVSPSRMPGAAALAPTTALSARWKTTTARATRPPRLSSSETRLFRRPRSTPRSGAPPPPERHGGTVEAQGHARPSIGWGGGGKRTLEREWDRGRRGWGQRVNLSCIALDGAQKRDRMP